MFETIILIGAGLFSLFCYYQKEEFKSSLQKKAKDYYEEEILKIERDHEYELSELQDKLNSAKSTISKLKAANLKPELVKKEKGIDKALASFI